MKVVCTEKCTYGPKGRFCSVGDVLEVSGDVVPAHFERAEKAKLPEKPVAEAPVSLTEATGAVKKKAPAKKKVK